MLLIDHLRSVGTQSKDFFRSMNTEITISFELTAFVILSIREIMCLLSRMSATKSILMSISMVTNHNRLYPF